VLPLLDFVEGARSGFVPMPCVFESLDLSCRLFTRRGFEKDIVGSVRIERRVQINRTLSAGNPAFNPYNYQTGSVWPHDNGIIAMGFKLYGFGAEAGRIAHDISVAASHFLLNQLPELYTAFQRDETTFPVQYIGANVPQAWAAGSIFMLTQAMLGFPATSCARQTARKGQSL
jgi:hypothetical protein